jgi:hypothetical protein
MRERYRKWGRVVRFEHGRVVRVDEAGEAIESAELFLASPLVVHDDVERVELPEVDEHAVVDTARAIEALVRTERLLVSDGVAEHECDGVRWQERTRRVHVAIPTGGGRALVDLASFDLGPLQRIAAANLAGERRVERVRLAPHVAAALLPHLIGIVDLEQAAGPHDGKGLPIEGTRVEGEPPNWYRPSYRVRPRRAWLNLRGRSSAPADEAAPEAVAILGAIDPGALRLLCIDGRDLFPVAVNAAALLL